MHTRKLIAGNWKMHGSRAALSELAAIAAAVHEDLDIAICPPFTLIAPAAAQAGPIRIGAQDCSPEPQGAHTGAFPPEILVEAGAILGIVGHGERRADHGETDPVVRAKAQAALDGGL